MCLKLTQIRKYTSWTARFITWAVLVFARVSTAPDLSEDPESDADYEEVR